MSNYTEWKTAVSTNCTDFETLNHYKACHIDMIELSVLWEDCSAIDWKSLQRNAAHAGIELWSYHLPFGSEINIASPDDLHRRSAIDKLSILMNQALSIGIRRFVIHPSAEPVPFEERDKWMAAACHSLAELSQHLAEHDAVLCVENLPRSCLGHNIEEMLTLTNADPRLHVCFDVNHLCQEYGTTHLEFIERLGSKIITTHMSDYDFIDEKHFFPGYGLINWKCLIEHLENVGYSGPFLYEGGFSPSYWAPEVPYGRIEEAHQRHMTIKDLHGKN